MVDAVSLWAKAMKEQNSINEISSVLNEEMVRKKLESVYKIEESFRYLNQVQQGGFLKQFVYRLERTEFRQLHSAGVATTFQRLFTRNDDVQKRIIRLREVRSLAVEDLGRILKRSKGVALNEYYDLQLIRPSWISLYLVPLATFGILGVVAFRFAHRLDWSAISTFFIDIHHASRHLVIDWIVNPMKNIWKTIRYQSTSVALVSPSALKADMDSLERMLITFAKKQYPEISPEIVSNQAQQGDVTLLLKRYEEELQHPLRNVISGDLVTMLLIQVQKSKVDLEGAMMAMDKLLKANELNFELLAIVPLLFILYSTIGAGRYYVRRWLSKTDNYYLQGMREKFHSLEALFNSGKDEFRVSGECLLLVQSILKDWSHLSVSADKKIADLFLDDLKELFMEIGNERKLWTLSRIYRFYPFLQLAPYSI